jgi:hypothetical protein
MELGLLLGVAIVIAIGMAIASLVADRQRARYRLDTYARPPGTRPLSAFVCPACLHRSYAAQHVRDRYCLKCDKSFPKPEEDGESDAVRE